MHPRTLALVFATAVIGTGCVSNETKPEATPAATLPTATSVATTVAAPAAEPAPVASKPVCAPEPKVAAKAKGKKATKAKDKKKAEVAAVDCEPAKPKSAATISKAAAVAATPAAEPPVAAVPAKAEEKPSDPGQPKIVKSRDGSFEGEVWGNIPPNSKWAKLQIGMEQSEVERILGVSTDVHSYPTAKAFIPFYYGTDRYRYEVRYRGQGSVSYTGGSWGAGAGIMMMINYDPKM
jgi:hypothetical protein